jgi:membrane protein DedA with SNARE-associated domain
MPALEDLTGPALYVALGLAALVEYVFPPFPGDSVSVLGGALVARAQGSLPLAVVALTVGSLVGIAAGWRAGLAFQGRLAQRTDDERLLGVSVGALKRAAERLRAQGAWPLLLNRFVPSLRALVFVAAGAAGLPLRRVLLWGGLSALLWNVLLVAVGAAVGVNAARIEAWLSTYRVAALSLVAAVVVVAVVRWVVRRSRE